jgi:hypothetical protein
MGGAGREGAHRVHAYLTTVKHHFDPSGRVVGKGRRAVVLWRLPHA